MLSEKRIQDDADIIFNIIGINTPVSYKKKDRPEYVDEDGSEINDNPDRDQHGNHARYGCFLKKSLLIEP